MREYKYNYEWMNEDKAAYIINRALDSNSFMKNKNDKQTNKKTFQNSK